MTVIVAHDTPDAIRGMLKRWFIEPRPNVFVGTLNRRTHEKTIEYIKRNAGEIGLLIISSYPNFQGFQIESCGPTAPRGVGVVGGGYSPRAWGWSVTLHTARRLWYVFPTCVGMVRPAPSAGGGRNGIP